MNSKQLKYEIVEFIAIVVLWVIASDGINRNPWRWTIFLVGLIALSLLNYHEGKMVGSKK